MVIVGVDGGEAVGRIPSWGKIAALGVRAVAS